MSASLLWVGDILAELIIPVWTQTEMLFSTLMFMSFHLSHFPFYWKNDQISHLTLHISVIRIQLNTLIY